MIKVIKEGYGYWDITRYPIGGKFCRAATDMPVNDVIRIGLPYKGADLKGRLPTGEYVAFSSVHCKED